MPGWLTWLGGVAFILGESTLLGAIGVTGWAIQAGLVCSLLLGLRRDFIPGALVMTALLPVADLLAGGPSGYYGFGLVVVFFVMQGLRGRLREEWGVTHLLVAGFGALLHPLVVAGTMASLGVDGSVVWAVVWSVPAGTLGVVAALWPAQWALETLDRLARRAGRARLDVD